jgi:transcription elongation factor Elf1
MNYRHLKPCPFCNAKTWDMNFKMDEGTRTAFVECGICKTVGPRVRIDEACRTASGKAWNKRKKAVRR